jgi:AcrR family transcriptional regulator
MQTPKEPNRINIIASARKEFVKAGYEKASMRRIAKNAGISTSNIYNYFKSKEEILETILKPALEGVEKGISLVSDDDYIERRLQFSYETLRARFNVALDFVDEHRLLFQLLICKTTSSKYERYLDELTDQVTQINLRQLEYFKKNHGIVLETNEFFVRNLVSFFFNIFVEMIRKDIPKAEIVKIEDQFLKFLHFGSKAILLDSKV